MFATGGERCPVALFDFYVSKRPVNLRNTGRFYLSPKSNPPSDDCWYFSRPIGHNTISQIMKKLVQGTSVSSNKRITNHSGRKTVVKKLKAAEIPESSIIKVTDPSTPPAD